MILEEAYSNNAKPDKQARLEIVQRVSLNEKEVQVRQNPRIIYERISFHIYPRPRPSWPHLTTTRLIRCLGNIYRLTRSSRSGSRTDDKTIDENRVLYQHKRLLLSDMEACTSFRRTQSQTLLPANPKRPSRRPTPLVLDLRIPSMHLPDLFTRLLQFPDLTPISLPARPSPPATRASHAPIPT